MKEKKIKSPKNWNKILWIILAGCTGLCFILGLILYAVGIRRILPVLLIFVFSFLLAMFILFLSKNTLEMRKAKEQRLATQKNV